MSENSGTDLEHLGFIANASITPEQRAAWDESRRRYELGHSAGLAAWGRNL